VDPDRWPAITDRVEDLVADKIFYPLDRDEHGTYVAPDFVITATQNTGQLLVPNCADYSDPAQTIYFGVTVATAYSWTHETSVSCAMPGRIYCFGVTQSQSVSLGVPATGRTAFQRLLLLLHAQHSLLFGATDLLPAGVSQNPTTGRGAPPSSRSSGLHLSMWPISFL
jgi:hypothetical protein